MHTTNSMMLYGNVRINNKICMKLNWLLSLVLIVLTISCNDDINQIGTSIDDTIISIKVDNSLTYTTSDSVYSVPAGPVTNRTIIQMLGAIDMIDYGSIRADFLTQMRSIANFDSKLVTEDMLDSLVLELGFLSNSFIGDSLTPMQVSVYPLNKVLESPLYSNIDPKDYYNSEDVLGKQIYSASRQSYPDSLLNSDGSRIIKIKLERPGHTSKELAQEFFRLYNSKNGILTENDLINFFPGIYVTNTYGKGVLINVLSSVIKIYHSTYIYDIEGPNGLKENEDLTNNDGSHPLAINKTSTSILVSSNEVPTINHIESTNAAYIENAIAEGRAIIKSPDGYDAHITFPVTEIIKKYREVVPIEAENNGTVSGLINAINFSIPIKESANNTFQKYGLTPPPYLLLMRAGGKVADSNGDIVEMDKNKFFIDRKLTDNLNYFYATYNSTTKSYDFGNIRGFITNIIQKNPNNGSIENGYPIDSDLILIPVSLTTSTSDYYGTTVDAITPYISIPTFVELDTKNIKIEMVYSTKTY